MTLPDFPEPVSPAPTRQAAPRFEPTLLPRLRTAHKALDARFGGLAGPIEREPAANIPGIEECARQFAAVRHIETVWLYPVLTQAVAADAGARAQFAELRLIGLMLARRVQRSFDELLQALRAEALVGDAALRLGSALGKYARHSEHAIYPLYELLETQRQDTARVA